MNQNDIVLRKKKGMNDFRVKGILMLLFILLFSSSIIAQETKTVSGKVFDSETNVALPGATVLLKGTSVGVSTDVNGSYSIAIPEGDNSVLVFQFLGYEDKEVPVNGRSVIDATLDIGGGILTDEMVVLGYGTEKKKVTSAAISTIGSDVISERTPLRLEQAFAGESFRCCRATKLWCSRLKI